MQQVCFVSVETLNFNTAAVKDLTSMFYSCLNKKPMLNQKQLDSASAFLDETLFHVRFKLLFLKETFFSFSVPVTFTHLYMCSI